MMIILATLPALRASALGTLALGTTTLGTLALGTMVMMMVVMGRVGWTVMVVVVMGFGWGWAVMVMMMVVFRSSPFTMIRPSLVALTPRTSTLGGRSVGPAVPWIAFAIFGCHSKFSTFIVMVVSVCRVWLWRFGGSEVVCAGRLGLALSRPVFLAVAPGAATGGRRAVRPEAAFVPAAFALLRCHSVFATLHARGRGSREIGWRFRWRYFRCCICNFSWQFLKATVWLRAMLPEVFAKIGAFIFAVSPRTSTIAMRSVF